MGRGLALALWMGVVGASLSGAVANAQELPFGPDLTPDAPAQAPPGRPQISEVELHLPPGSDASGLVPLVEVRRGQTLSARAVRRSLERLFATGRFADIVVRAVPGPTGVTVVLDLTPVQKVVRVDVTGNTLLTNAEVLTAAKLVEGSEFYPERIEEVRRGVRRGYALHGYRHAQVSAETREVAGGVAVLLHLQEGVPTRMRALTVAGSPGLPLQQVLNALGLKVGEVLDLALLDAGIERVKALYREQHFDRARVGEPAFAEGPGDTAVVSLPVQAGPQFTFHFHGNRRFPDSVLMGVLHYQANESLDRTVIARLSRRLATFYRYRGFLDATVEPHETQSPSGSRAVLAFNITEGPPVRVRTLRFTGNRALSSAALRQVLEDTVHDKAPVPQGDIHPTEDPLSLEGQMPKPDPEDAPNPPAREIYVEDAYREALQTMTELYREQGYLSASVVLSDLDIDVPRHTAGAVVQVHEGPRAMVAKVEIQGTPPGVVLAVDPELAVGRPFHGSALEQARLGLTRTLGRGGYLFGTVEASREVSPDGTQVSLHFQVTAGPQVRVGQIILRGLGQTQAALVRANLKMRSGEILDPDALLDTQRDLVVLGVFRQVAVQLIAPDTVEPVKDIVVDLKERPRFSNELSLGYFLAEGPRVIGAVSYPNLFGRALDLSLRAKLNYVGASTLTLINGVDAKSLQGLQGLDYRVTVSLHEPHVYNLLPALLGVRLDVVGERVHRPSYTYARQATIAGLDWTARKWLNLSLQYELENDQVTLTPGPVSTLTPVDNIRLRFPQGQFILQSVGPSASIDFRDDPINPRKGFLFSVGSEVTKDLYVNERAATTGPNAGAPVTQSPIFTLKASTNLSVYVPLGKRVTLALSGRAGQIFLLDPNSITIAPKRFFLGGATSFRGFREDGLLPSDVRDTIHTEVAGCKKAISPVGCTPAASTIQKNQEVLSQGGTLYTLGKGELRFPIYKEFDLGVFFEAGNLWLNPGAYRPENLRYVAGTGIRYVTPVGPLALDVGFNLVPDLTVNESLFQIQFSVGLF